MELTKEDLISFIDGLREEERDEYFYIPQTVLHYIDNEAQIKRMEDLYKYTEFKIMSHTKGLYTIYGV